jgi:hypothetical protein
MVLRKPPPSELQNSNSSDNQPPYPLSPSAAEPPSQDLPLLQTDSTAEQHNVFSPSLHESPAFKLSNREEIKDLHTGDAAAEGLPEALRIRKPAGSRKSGESDRAMDQGLPDSLRVASPKSSPRSSGEAQRSTFVPNKPSWATATEDAQGLEVVMPPDNYQSNNPFLKKDSSSTVWESEAARRPSASGLIPVAIENTAGKLRISLCGFKKSKLICFAQLHQST